MGFTFTAKSEIELNNDGTARVMCRPVSSLVWGTDKEWWSSKVGKAQSVPAPWKLRQGDFYGLVAEMSRWKMVLNGVDKGFIHPNQPERAPLAICGQLEQQTAAGKKSIVFILQMDNKFYKEEVIAKC